MPKFCEPQELLLKPEMGSTLARHFEKNFIQIVYMKYYLKKKKKTLLRTPTGRVFMVPAILYITEMEHWGIKLGPDFFFQKIMLFLHLFWAVLSLGLFSSCGVQASHWVDSTRAHTFQ